jgi:putative transcription factor
LLTIFSSVILMLCEMCGREVTFCKKVIIEGVPLEVCTECAKFGKDATKSEPQKGPEPKPIISQRLEVREKRLRQKDIYDKGGQEELVSDYGDVLRRARVRAGMTVKDLALKINEKATVLSKVEAGTMRPEDKLVAKLEKELGITLKEKVATVLAARQSGQQRGLTLADLIKIKE